MPLKFSLRPTIFFPRISIPTPITLINPITLITLITLIGLSPAHSQPATPRHYNLAPQLQAKTIDTTSSWQDAHVSDSAGNNAISTRGILWLKGVDFTEGTIDIDLRGKNVFLQSFMGVAFHAKDTNSYDVVYFCPFRFRDTSATTRKYGVKYMSFPDYSYTKLRKDHPGIYENSVDPAPLPEAWFHATIVVRDNWITVYTNHSPIASLKVQRLPTLSSGKLGLWSYSQTLSSDFANLTITR